MEWSAEADAVLLDLLERYVPCGVHRPWAISSLRCALRNALPSCSSVTNDAVQRRVSTYYNFDSTVMDDVREALERFLRTQRDFHLPRQIWLASERFRKEIGDADTGGCEHASSEAMAKSPSPQPDEGQDERAGKRRRRSPSPIPSAKRSNTSTGVTPKQEKESIRRRQQRAEEIYLSVRAKTGRFQSVAEMAYGAMRDLGGSATFDALATYIESKHVWAQLERKQALRIEKDPKTSGEELRSQLRQALGNGCLFKERSDGYALTESDVTQSASASQAEGSLAV